MAQATYYGEETTIVFTGRWIKDSYGVPGSPEWWEVENVEIDRVFLYDVEVDHKKLPAELLDVFYELAGEIDSQDWE